MTGTGVKGEVVLPKVQPVSCDLWWSKAPKWQDGAEPLIGPRRYAFTVTLSRYGVNRMLVDCVETAEPLPKMNREEAKLLCDRLHDKLEHLTGTIIGPITNDLFLELHNGEVKQA